MFDASVDLLGNVPSVAFKGAHTDEVAKLVKKYIKQGKSLKDLMK